MKKNKFVSLMDSLASKFLSCYPVSKLDWQEIKDISWEEQLDLLNSTVLHHLNIKYPIKRKYQYAFLKSLVKKLEENSVEVHDAIYEHLAALCRYSDDPSDFTFKHYSLRSKSTIITLKESNSFISEGTTGLCSWQASLALSEWLLANSNRIAGKVILELGAGTGLSGIVATKCCQAKMTILSDGSPPVVNLLKENVELNFSSDCRNIKTCLLRWEDESALNFCCEIVPEILLGADITFDSSVFPALISMLCKLFKLSNDLCVFYLAATIRNNETFEKFIQLLEQEQFNVCEETYVKPRNNLIWDETTPIRILCITRLQENGFKS